MFLKEETLILNNLFKFWGNKQLHVPFPPFADLQTINQSAKRVWRSNRDGCKAETTWASATGRCQDMSVLFLGSWLHKSFTDKCTNLRLLLPPPGSTEVVSLSVRSGKTFFLVASSCCCFHMFSHNIGEKKIKWSEESTFCARKHH